jgi:hypothetical protein
MSELGIFSEGCLSRCVTPRKLGEKVLCYLMDLRVGTCPGVACGPDGTSICSLPGEATEAILKREPDAPGTMVYEATAEVVAGRLDPDWLPTAATQGDTAPLRWQWVAHILDELYMMRNQN